MAVHQSEAAKGQTPVAYPAYAGHVVAQRYAFTVPANIVEGDIVEMACIPPGCRVIDVVMDSDDLDTGTPAIIWDVGIMSGDWGVKDNARTCGDEFLDGVTVSQAGGVVRPTLAKAFRTSAAATARSIGAKLVTDAATAAAGTIGLTVLVTTAP